MKTKILLVDDEKDIVAFLEYNLVQEGFEVITAYNGMEALKKLSEKPDLVILDIMMPQLNGYDVCKKIRSLPEFRQTPVIFLTASADTEARLMLDRLFGRHPVSSRTIALLHYLDGLTLEQVAEVVGLSVSGVRKRLRGLRHTLLALEKP